MNSDVSPTDDYYTAEIDELGIRAVEAYQRQQELAHRLWAYFNQYSGLMVLLSLIAVVFRGEKAILGIPPLAIAIPPLAYIFFFWGNHIALEKTMHELNVMRGVAWSKTRLNLRERRVGQTQLFHLMMAVSSLAIYVLSWYHILKSGGSSV